ncbi:MAG: MarR family transcriptional regulator [Lysobacterales bacterium]
MSLLDRHPDSLIAHHEPAEILAALRESKSLTAAQAHRLDTYLLHWSNLILHRPADREGVLELLSVSERARDQLPAGAADVDGLGIRWTAFEDLLELRRRVLQQANQAGKLGRQDEILALIRDHHGPIRQVELTEQLKLSAGRVSQVLGLLEERGLITRRREGRECWVSIAASGSASTSHRPHSSPVALFRPTQAA